MSDQEKQKPIKQFRCGAVAVAVWKKEHNGEVFYSATPSRAFTRDDGKTFEYSDTFNREDLPVLATLLNGAFYFIVGQSAK